MSQWDVYVQRKPVLKNSLKIQVKFKFKFLKQEFTIKLIFNRAESLKLSAQIAHPQKIRMFLLQFILYMK